MVDNGGGLNMLILAQLHNSVTRLDQILCMNNDPETMTKATIPSSRLCLCINYRRQWVIGDCRNNMYLACFELVELEGQKQNNSQY